MPLGLDQINAFNPWWTDPEWQQRDRHLVSAVAAPFVWDPRPFDAEDIASGSVFTLRGPRQSGKTTITKRLIADRVDAGAARRTCFLSLRTIETQSELREAIESVLRLWPGEAGNWLFVLDELTFVKGWANVVADLHEHNADFARATVILTGSSAADLTDSADILHGRRGPSRRKLDRLHTPMSFRDYAMARAPGVALPPSCRIEELIDANGRETLLEMSLRTAELTQYLEEYARCGGLPAPVSDMLRDQRVDEATTLGLWRGLAADIRRLDRNEARLEKLVSRAVVALSSTGTDAEIAREMGVSRPTAADYIGVLAQSFALIVLHERDPKRQGGPSLTKPRKLYFGDPAFAAIPQVLAGGPVAPISSLVENVLAVALFRHAERDALMSFREPSRIFLWRSSDGREIDFLVPAPSGIVPIESKFARKMDGKDYESMEKAFPGPGVMVSLANLLLDRRTLTVPAGVFLALLG